MNSFDSINRNNSNNAEINKTFSDTYNQGFISVETGSIYVTLKYIFSLITITFVIFALICYGDINFGEEVTGLYDFAIFPFYFAIYYELKAQWILSNNKYKKGRLDFITAITKFIKLGFSITVTALILFFVVLVLSVFCTLKQIMFIMLGFFLFDYLIKTKSRIKDVFKVLRDGEASEEIRYLTNLVWKGNAIKYSFFYLFYDIAFVILTLFGLYGLFGILSHLDYFSNTEYIYNQICSIFSFVNIPSLIDLKSSIWIFAFSIVIGMFLAAYYEKGKASIYVAVKNERSKAYSTNKNDSDRTSILMNTTVNTTPSVSNYDKFKNNVLNIDERFLNKNNYDFKDNYYYGSNSNSRYSNASGINDNHNEMHVYRQKGKEYKVDSYDDTYKEYCKKQSQNKDKYDK